MAEVLFGGELSLQNHLRYIICRSPYDKITLLSLLTPELYTQFHEIVKIEKIPGTFFVLEYSLYIRDIKFYENQLILSLKHPNKVEMGDYKCKIKQSKDGILIGQRELTLPLSYTPQSISGFNYVQDCDWEIELEDVLAFSGKIPSESSSVV